MRPFTVLLTILCIALPALSELDDGTRRTIAKSLDGKFEAFDRTGDGALDAVEQKALLAMVARRYAESWVEPVRTAFQEADRDGDGLLTEAEWKTWAKPHLAPPALPRKQTVMVSMADGVKLATDVYLPPEGEGPWPALLMRTPYNKNRTNPLPWTLRGYALVVQDQRGRYASEGENLPFIGCGWDPHQDGKDTLAWMVGREWCNGRIGTLGGSALGITQNLLAGSDPGPALEAQYISVAAASLYHHAAYVGGAYRRSQIEVWVRGNGYAEEAIPAFLEHPEFDEFWERFDTTERHHLMTSPAIHTGGWFDTFSLGTVTSFTGRQRDGGKGAKGRQKLVMGPWTHGGRGRGKVGDLEFPNSEFPSAYSSRAWFDHHLKGVENGVMDLPAVAYYAMGESGKVGGPGNEWRHAGEWPVPNTPAKLYFRKGDRLSVERSAAEEEYLDYVFDPRRPCPTEGGCNLVIAAGPKEQGRVAKREDVLSFTSDPMEEPVEVTGQARAVIFISSSAVDTDLSVRLVDVYPDGKSYLMAEGMLRVRYRTSFRKRELMVPGRIYRIEVELWPTSVVFDVGHRIGLMVTSSNHPRFDVNPGTGKPFVEGDETVEQRNRIHTGKSAASHLILPVVE